MAIGDNGNLEQAKLKGDIVSYAVKANTTIYRGTFVAIDASGYLVQASDATGLVSVGFAEEHCEAGSTNGLKADGSPALVRVRRRGIFRCKKSSNAAVTDVGIPFYAVTAQSVSGSTVTEATVASTSTYGVTVGMCTKIESTSSPYIWLDIYQAIVSSSTAVTTHLNAATSHNGTQITITDTADYFATNTVESAITALAERTSSLPAAATKSSSTGTVSTAEFQHGLVILSYAGAQTITLPAASAALVGRECTFVKTGTTGAIAMARAGSDTINGGTSWSSGTAQYNAFKIMCTTSSTFIVSALGVNS